MSRYFTLRNVGPKTVTVGNVGSKTVTGQNHNFNCIFDQNGIDLRDLFASLKDMENKKDQIKNSLIS